MQAISRQPQRAPDGTPVHYERHRPEQTTLHRLAQQHAATFFARAGDAAGADLPQFVKDEFDAFLECGILAHGFLRLHCGDCGHDKLVTPVLQVVCRVITRHLLGQAGLNTAMRCGADDRHALEQLCRYITRPALANERVQTNAAVKVVLKLKTAWRDGTTHLVMSPLEFMQRLAALVPRARLHLIRFYGVLAHNAKLRSQVVPRETEAPAQAAKPAEYEANCAHHRPVRLSRAKLLKRVFEIDTQHCPNCGGELKISAAILEQPMIEKILMHLGLQARAPPRAPVRGQALQAA